MFVDELVRVVSGDRSEDIRVVGFEPSPREENGLKADIQVFRFV